MRPSDLLSSTVRPATALCSVCSEELKPPDARDLLAASDHSREICVTLERFLISGDLLLNWELAHRLPPLRRTSTPLLSFMRFFVFELAARTRQTDSKTGICIDGRIDGWGYDEDPIKGNAIQSQEKSAVGDDVPWMRSWNLNSVRPRALLPTQTYCPASDNRKSVRVSRELSKSILRRFTDTPLGTRQLISMSSLHKNTTHG